MSTKAKNESFLKNLSTRQMFSVLQRTQLDELYSSIAIYANFWIDLVHSLSFISSKVFNECLIILISKIKASQNAVYKTNSNSKSNEQIKKRTLFETEKFLRDRTVQQKKV